MEKKRKYYSAEYKAEALKLALKIGVLKTAEELYPLPIKLRDRECFKC